MKKHKHTWKLVWTDLSRYIYRCSRCHEIGYGVP
jgi:hypothetical protein